MTYRRLCIILMALAVLVALSVSACFAGVVYVKATGDDGNSGLSWLAAKATVQAGLNAAVVGDEVWVAAGFYNAAITMKAGVGLYGGFAGTETARIQRDCNSNICTLDGSYSNSVVTIPSGSTRSTIVDGFVVTHGAGTILNGDPEATYGGAFFMSYASPTISNNTICENTAGNFRGDGGGIYCSYGSPLIANNNIFCNTVYGGSCGAIYTNESNAVITGNSITDNYSFVVETWGGYTGGVGCNGGSVLITHNIIATNCSRTAGGLYLSDCNATVSNNFIRGNSATFDSADFGGGGIYAAASTGSVTNNHIIYNEVYADGGGMYVWDCPQLAISNNIIAFNSSGIYAGGWSQPYAPTLRNNDVYDNNLGSAPHYGYLGLMAGLGDISANPMLLETDRLAFGSPCIDAGWNGASGLTSTDCDGQGRIYNGTIDIGADERWP